MLTAVLGNNADASTAQDNELSKKCDREKKSIFKENNGMPSCQRLISIQKEKEDPKSNLNSTETYRWNSGTGTFCYFDISGEIKSCP
jgi:hypothetical protein